MRIGPYRFRPALLPSLVVALVLPLLLALGSWQLERAEEKQALLQDLAAGRTAAPVDLNETQPDYAAIRYRRAVAAGRWDPEHQFLVENQVRDTRLGYLVLTPLRLADGRAVLVDRGWVPAAADLDKDPDVAIAGEAAVVEGVVDRGPVVGLRMGEAGASGDDWPHRLVYLDYGYIEAQLGYPVLPYLIHLDPDAADGYRRDWQPVPPKGPETHWSYAFQWFALAAALVVIYLVVNLKRVEPADADK